MESKSGMRKRVRTPPTSTTLLASRGKPALRQATSLYQLLDTHFDILKRLWEERFERRYGFWQAFWDTAAWAEGRGDIWAVDVVYK
jgi:hypothetical protein